jgi:hypothetical protein
MISRSGRAWKATLNSATGKNGDGIDRVMDQALACRDACDPMEGPTYSAGSAGSANCQFASFIFHNVVFTESTDTNRGWERGLTPLDRYRCSANCQFASLDPSALSWNTAPIRRALQIGSADCQLACTLAGKLRTQPCSAIGMERAGRVRAQPFQSTADSVCDQKRNLTAN